MQYLQAGEITRVIEILNVLTLNPLPDNASITWTDEDE